MAKITRRGIAMETEGDLLKVGVKAPDFNLTGFNKEGTAVVRKTLKDFAGKFLVLNIFPDISTKVCPETVKKFDAAALNFLTVSGHTLVLISGNIFRTKNLPAKSFNVFLTTAVPSLLKPVKLKSGAFTPTLRRSPSVSIAIPRRVIFAIMDLLIKLIHHLF